MRYYERLDVRRVITDFAEGRECAFYNARIKSLQRNLGEDPVTLDSAAAFDRALAFGATAFYCSYWRYPTKDFSRALGHDLVWTIRVKRGPARSHIDAIDKNVRISVKNSGRLDFAKEVLTWVIEALVDGGLPEPWIKYSGQLGFDLLIPLEAIPNEAWVNDNDALGGLQRGLTNFVASHLTERSPSVRVNGASSPLEIKRGTETCLLSELRARRGLLLAPMSLNPDSGLVSVPVSPREVMEFSVLDASPADARALQLASPLRIAHELMKYARPWCPSFVQTELDQLTMSRTIENPT